MKKLLFIFGTRPEAIKMIPLIEEFKNNKDKFAIEVCVTAQHREMLDQILNFFKIVPNYDLNIMEKNQTLFDITKKILSDLERVLIKSNPDFVIVQGDTTTAFVAALSAFYFKKQIVHIEAGLRSLKKYSPYPEEMNRILVGHLANIHFAPTKNAVSNLKREGITENVYLVGNSVIDALFLTLKIINQEQLEKNIINFFNKHIANFAEIIKDKDKKIILVTGHRRESFGEPFENICNAILKITKKYKNVHIIYPVHFNPNVREPVNRILGGKDRIHLIEPLDYPHLVWLMNKSYIILTDSGGIQEEAPSLNKPVLVLREVTERVEGIKAKTAKLVGTDVKKIVSETSKLLENIIEYKKMVRRKNPYGDGTTCFKIRKIMEEICV